MNVTDICPVGALTNRDFRFKARVWEMSFTESICNGCARGCNIEIGVRNNEILRLHPRFNKEVNDYWMCDNGRLNTFKHVNAEDRVDGPYVRRDGQLEKADWDAAFSEAASQLKSFNSGEIAFVGSAYAACEDNFVFAKFAKNILGAKNVDFFRHTIVGDEDGLLIREDKTPNALGAELTGIKPAQGGADINGIVKGIESGKIKALYLLEDDLLTVDPAYESLLSKLNLLIVHSTNFNQTTKSADIVFPASTYAEKNGTMVNFQGRLQRLRPAVATVDMDRSLDHMEQSRWDKFGTKFDKWARGAKKDARPSWKIISTLSTTMGHKMRYNTVEDVFEEMAKTLPEFAKFDYDVVGESGVLLKEAKSSVKV
jgi:NADH-quinone oxidoreductase subunit G